MSAKLRLFRCGRRHVTVRGRQARQLPQTPHVSSESAERGAVDAPQFTCLADDVMCTCLSARSQQMDGRTCLAARIVVTWYDEDISLQL